jgi:hypothetical protein
MIETTSGAFAMMPPSTRLLPEMLCPGKKVGAADVAAALEDDGLRGRGAHRGNDERLGQAGETDFGLVAENTFDSLIKAGARVACGHDSETRHLEEMPAHD